MAPLTILCAQITDSLLSLSISLPISPSLSPSPSPSSLSLPPLLPPLSLSLSISLPLSLSPSLPPSLPPSLSPSPSLPLDINECSRNSDNCDQLCTNTEGGFNCSCNDGFILQFDMSSCIGEQTHDMLKFATHTHVF